MKWPKTNSASRIVSWELIVFSHILSCEPPIITDLWGIAQKKAEKPVPVSLPFGENSSIPNVAVSDKMLTWHTVCHYHARPLHLGAF